MAGSDRKQQHGQEGSHTAGRGRRAHVRERAQAQASHEQNLKANVHHVVFETMLGSLLAKLFA
jgi:hypothetical protein